jgi:hypothetical protein
VTKHNIRSEYTPEEYHQIKIAAAIANKSIHQYVHDTVIDSVKTLSVMPLTPLRRPAPASDEPE